MLAASELGGHWLCLCEGDGGGGDGGGGDGGGGDGGGGEGGGGDGDGGGGEIGIFTEQLLFYIKTAFIY